MESVVCTVFNKATKCKHCRLWKFNGGKQPTRNLKPVHHSEFLGRESDLGGFHDYVMENHANTVTSLNAAKLTAITRHVKRHRKEGTLGICCGLN